MSRTANIADSRVLDFAGGHSGRRYNADMSGNTREFIDIFEKLPESLQAEVTDFARFLLARKEDAAWERTLADGKPRPKLDAFLKASKAEGSKPLDAEQL